jgi:hypothetical protein
MRRGSVIALLIALMVSIVAGQGIHVSTLAQDATPPSEQAVPLEGVSVVTLAARSIEVLAPGTANLVLARIRVAPDATLPLDPADSSVNLVYMSGGTLTFRVDAPITVTRVVRPGTPIPTEPEAIAADTEFTMSDGESALFPPNIAGEVRNDGDEDATAWVTSMALFTEDSATPTP